MADNLLDELIPPTVTDCVVCMALVPPIMSAPDATICVLFTLRAVGLAQVLVDLCDLHAKRLGLDRAARSDG